MRILRSAGHGERAVAVVSSALFALSHSVNLLSGQPILTVGVTIAYTFGFGLLMYLVLRVTGSLIWPMLLHGLTDPTTMLALGGIDSSTVSASNSLLNAAAPFNLVFILCGLLAIFFIRGRSSISDATPEAAGSHDVTHPTACSRQSMAAGEMLISRWSSLSRPLRRRVSTGSTSGCHSYRRFPSG